MTKTINDFLSPDDLMLAGPAENAPSDYWSKPAIEGDGNQKQGLTWDVVRATDEINKQAQQNFDYTNPFHYINPLKWGPAAGATLVEGVIDPLAQYARGEDVSRGDAALAAAEVIPGVGAGARIAGQRSAVDEITAPVKVNYGRYAGRRAVPAGILGSGIAYGTYENE